MQVLLLVKKLEQQKIWLVWKAVGEASPGHLDSVKLNHVVHDGRDIPMPNVVAGAALQAQLEQAALLQGDKFPFCPCKYLDQYLDKHIMQRN